MAKSFVRQIYLKSLVAASNKIYLRGPTLLGNQTGPLGTEVAQFIRQRLAALGNPKIVLTGYSRGGASVITTAQLLRILGIRVDLMILFDAVDRSLTAMAGVIPSNVARVYHLRRSILAVSRPYFGNCGTWWNPFTTRYTEKKFNCTHGGVGGCPWWTQPDRGPTARISDRIRENGLPTLVTYQEDLTGSTDAWEWIRPFLVAEGVLGNAT
jgi:pimeloyl-ACP methyl ester carboxylesterase